MGIPKKGCENIDKKLKGAGQRGAGSRPLPLYGRNLRRCGGTVLSACAFLQSVAGQIQSGG